MKRGLGIVGQGESTCAVEVGAGSALDVSQKGVLNAKTYRGKAAIVTLGCAKNQVDSEVMLGVLSRSGFELVNDVESADVAVVNTCGFLESSTKESIDCILELAELKQQGRLRTLIVAGCLVSRYPGELQKTLPEVDHFLSTDEILKVGSVAGGSDDANFFAEAARPYFLYDDTLPRFLSTRPHMAYVKVSEGCNRPCTFCIIPKIRGQMRSRMIESVVKEIQTLSANGVREVNLVAQDLTSYGRDLRGPELADLLLALEKQTSIDWIRLLYAYPVGTDERLLKTMQECSRVAPYLDIPLQHSSERVLKEMQRPVGRFAPRSMVDFIRKQYPALAVRTTFIVGFPGETEQDVEDLERFILEGHFSNVGVFTYSQERGTPAGERSDQIPEKEREQRRKRLMKAQQKVISETLQGYIGTSQRVLIEGPHEDTDLLLAGRTSFQAPEVDGIVMINDSQVDLDLVRAGQFAQVEITEVAGYDLLGVITKIEDTNIKNDSAS